MSLILFMGKGGTGKTTCALATALKLAEKGKTLIASTDVAHSLSDVLDVNLMETNHVEGNLYATQIDVYNEAVESYGTLGKYFKEILEELHLDPTIIASDLSTLVGLEEFVSLLKIQEFIESDYDHVVLDCPPSGASIRMLALPDLVNRRIQRMIRTERRKSQAKRILSLTDEREDELYDQLEKITEKAIQSKEILYDTEKTLIRLVLNPDEPSLLETQRTFSLTVKVYLPRLKKEDFEITRERDILHIGARTIFGKVNKKIYLPPNLVGKEIQEKARFEENILEITFEKENSEEEEEDQSQ